MDTTSREFVEEELIEAANEKILQLMQRSGITRTKLAKLTGTTRGNITNRLHHKGGMEIRTLAMLCHALGYRIRLVEEPLTKKES